jgi:hypothetical protein
MYKENLNNMEDKRLPKIASNSSEKPPSAKVGMAQGCLLLAKPLRNRNFQ